MIKNIHGVDEILVQYHEYVMKEKLNKNQCIKLFENLKNQGCTNLQIRYFLKYSIEMKDLRNISDMKSSTISNLNAFFSNAKSIKDYANILFEYKEYNVIFKDFKFLFTDDKDDEYCLNFDSLFFMNLVDNKEYKINAVEFHKNIISFNSMKNNKKKWIKDSVNTNAIYGVPNINMKSFFNAEPKCSDFFGGNVFHKIILNMVISVTEYKNKGIIIECDGFYLVMKYLDYLSYKQYIQELLSGYTQEIYTRSYDNINHHHKNVYLIDRVGYHKNPLECIII